LKRNVVAFLSRTESLRSSIDGRDQPAILSAIFFTSSSMGIGIIPLQVVHGSGGARLRRLAFPQVQHQLWKRETVKHAVRGHTALPRHLNAPVRQVDLVRRMRIRVDAHDAPEFKRTFVPTPVEIEPPWIGIDCLFFGIQTFVFRRREA
jgi:hypothetical protein